MDEQLQDVAPAVASSAMNRAAQALIGAASGGVLGLLLAGLAGLGRRFTGPLAMAASLVAVLGCAVAVAAVNVRGQRAARPAGRRSAWGVILTSAGLLLTLLLFLVQSTYIQVLTGRGEKAELPLAIWPFSRVVLWGALAAVGVGVLAALLGWIQGLRAGQKEGRWMAMALLATGAWAALSLAVYATGHGLVFGQ